MVSALVSFRGASGFRHHPQEPKARVCEAKFTESSGAKLRWASACGDARWAAFFGGPRKRGPGLVQKFSEDAANGTQH